MEELIDIYKKKGNPVVCIVTEPIQCEGGDNFASAQFFQGLQDIAEKVSNLFSVFMIICMLWSKDVTEIVYTTICLQVCSR